MPQYSFFFNSKHERIGNEFHATKKRTEWNKFENFSLSSIFLLFFVSSLVNWILGSTFKMRSHYQLTHSWNVIVVTRCGDGWKCLKAAPCLSLFFSLSRSLSPKFHNRRRGPCVQGCLNETLRHPSGNPSKNVRAFRERFLRPSMSPL